MSVRRQSIEDWASETAFETPLKWGEIEREILRRRHAPLPNESVGLKVFDIAMLLATPLLIFILVGTSVLGLALVIAGLHAADPGTAAGLVGGARLPLVFTVCVSGATLLDVGDDSWRQRSEVFVVAFHGVVTSIAYVLLGAHPDVEGAASTRWYALVAAVVSFVAMLVQIFFEVRARRRRSRNAGRDLKVRKAKVPASFYGQERCRVARARVMEILDERGLTGDLQESRKQKMLRMPLGSWSGL